MVEHYPFGRNFLDAELRYLIDGFRRHNPKGSVFSSVRDIFDTGALDMRNIALFDRFLVHADEKIV